MRNEPIRKIEFIDIVIIILFILSLYLILTRVFGHSATEIAITTGLFTFTIGLVFKGYTELSRINREIGEIKINMKNGFENVRKDIESLRRKR